MTNPADLREALRANLAAVTGCQVSAYLLANPTPPCLMILGGAVEYDRAMIRGADTWTYTVQALAGLVTDQGAQRTLDTWRRSSGTGSVKAAAETDRTLGGNAHDMKVTAVSADAIYSPDGKGPFLGCEFTVEITAPGT